MILEPLESLNSQLFFFMIARYLRDADRHNRICGESIYLHLCCRILASILYLGRVSKFPGCAHVLIALNSQNTIPCSYACQQWTIPVVVLCFSTKYKASMRSYFALTL